VYFLSGKIKRNHLEGVPEATRFDLENLFQVVCFYVLYSWKYEIYHLYVERTGIRAVVRKNYERQKLKIRF